MTFRRWAVIAYCLGVLAATAAFGLSLALHSPLIISLICIWGLMWLAPLSVLAVILVTIILWRRKQTRNRVLIIAGAWLLFLFLLIPAEIAGTIGASVLFSRDKAVAERLATTIAAYRDRTGNLPKDMAELEAAGIKVKLPRYRPAGSISFYDVNSDGSFSLRLQDPTKFVFPEVRYDSSTGLWEDED